MLHDDAALMFQEELNAGEKLLWSGRPKQGLMLRPVDTFLIPFALLWAGGAVLALTSSAVEGDSFAAIPLCFFVIIGFYITIGRFLYDIRQRARTYYGLTSERVLILSGLFSRTVKSVNLRTLQEISLSTKRNGRGTITFGSSPFPYNRQWAGMWGFGYEGQAAFEGIENAREVYRLIQQAQKAGQA